uniref:Uncharacterized protein n=1 Tax=Chenopodium quinoa TaxID=63459 RepID=A0A803KMV8_CHEQI
MPVVAPAQLKSFLWLAAGGNISMPDCPDRCGGSMFLWWRVVAEVLFCKKRGGEIMTGCASVCANEGASMNASNCYGVGCCQASLLSSPTGDFLDREEGLDFYQIALDHLGLSNFTNAMCQQP